MAFIADEEIESGRFIPDDEPAAPEQPKASSPENWTYESPQVQELVRTFKENQQGTIGPQPPRGAVEYLQNFFAPSAAERAGVEAGGIVAPQMTAPRALAAVPRSIVTAVTEPFMEKARQHIPGLTPQEAPYSETQPGISPQAIETFYKGTHPLESYLYSKAPEAVKDVVGAAGEQAAEIASGMTSPQAVKSVPTYMTPVVGPLLMAKEGIEGGAAAAAETIEAAKQGDLIGMTKGIVKAGAALGMAIPGAAGLIKTFTPKPSPKVVPPKAAELFAKTETILPESTRAARAIAEKPIEVEAAVIPETPAEVVAEAPKPDWRVSVQEPQKLPNGETVPGFVQIIDPRQTEVSKSPTIESLRASGVEVPDFSKLKQGQYTYEQAVNAANEAVPKPVAAAEVQLAPSSPHDFIPGLRKASGELLTGTKGKIHDDIYNALPGDDGLILKAVDQPEHVFVNPKTGEVLSRAQLDERFGVTDSQQLRDLQNKTPQSEAATAEPMVTLYNGGDTQWFTTNPQQAAGYGPVRSVQVPKSVADAAQAEVRSQGVGTPGYKLSKEWSDKAAPVAVEPTVIDPTISETIGGKAGEQSKVNASQSGVSPPSVSAPTAEPISAVKKGGESNALQGKEKVQEEILDAQSVQQLPQPEPAPSNVPIEATTATPAVGSSQSLGITPPGTQQLQALIDAAISKPQGVDTPIRTDVSTPLPDFQPHASSKKIFSQPFGFERLPVLGALWGGLRRLKGNVNEAITAYHGERNVGRAVASALAQEYSWIKKPFTIKDGQIQNIGATEGQSRYISDVFEALQRDPNAYPLSAEQRAAFDAMQKLEVDFKKLEQKYGLSKAIEEEGGVGTEGGEGQRAYFPRVVVEAPEGRGRTLGTGAKVGGKAFFEKSRLFETEAEGWQKGWKYEEDIARRIATRAERLYKRIADKRLADDPTLGGISRKELDAQLKDGYAEELAAGEITEAKLQQIGDSIESQGRVWQPQFFNKIFPRETADAMNKAFPQTQSGLRSMAANANNALKGLWLGFDLGAGFIQGQGTMFYQPKVWAKAQANSLRAMVSPEFFPEYVRQNLEPIREMAQLGSSVGRMEEMLAGAERGELLNRIPGVKQTIGKAIQPFARQFQTFIDTAKVELWKGLRETTPKEEWPRVMQTIESTLSTSRMEPVGISAGRALTERALLIAPSYYRGALNLVAGMAEKGVSGQVARRAMGAYMAGGALLFYGVGKALGMSDEDLVKRFDPRRSDFMLWRIKTGERTTEVGFGGIFKSLMKLGGNIVKTSTENPENWKSLSPEKNPITRWYRGHAGPAVGLVWDQFSGKDFMGQEANLGDLSQATLPMVLRRAGSLVERIARFTGGTAFERVNPASQEVNKLAAEYRKKTGLPDTADFVTKETPARKVREALQQKDTKAAMSALQELRKTKKDPDIWDGFKQSRTRPFTGSMEREAKFKASLTPQQRALYDSAKAERDRDWEAFRELWRNKPSR